MVEDMSSEIPEPEIIRNIGPDTYKSDLLSLKAQQAIFVIYHIMKLRNGDFMPSKHQLNAIAEEHGVFSMNLEDMIGHERWLRL